jgi:hypothetical protein
VEYLPPDRIRERVAACPGVVFVPPNMVQGALDAAAKK